MISDEELFKKKSPLCQAQSFLLGKSMKITTERVNNAVYFLFCLRSEKHEASQRFWCFKKKSMLKSL